MNYDKLLEDIRPLSRDQKPTQDITTLLMNHRCDFLLKKHGYTSKKDVLNKLCVAQRFKTCRKIFLALEENNIPYAVIKGAVLSQMAYGDPFCRKSGDIDLLICREDVDAVKQLLLDNGFVQGRITETGISPFSRKELLFQTAMSHQTAPFLTQTENPFCPYVNVDVNLDIFWGEHNQKMDMQFVLEHTKGVEICGNDIKKLIPEMEFISLCLHHYKDANSIYLLWGGGLRLSLFCDVYFYLKSNPLNLQTLKAFCQRLQAGDYVYYCIYYANLIFDDVDLLSPYLEALESDSARGILNTLGLAENEVRPWNVPFLERLFSGRLKEVLEKIFTPEDFRKIRMNTELMR